MNIYTAEQIRAWDAYTITHEPTSSLNLMERAAERCVRWLLAQPFQNRSFRIFCGKGNNGGDGLAIARLLIGQGMDVEVYILETGKKGSPDFQANLQRLNDWRSCFSFIQSETDFPVLQPSAVVIDALFGSGLNKPLEGLAAALVSHINNSKTLVVAIDVPSGLHLDRSSKGNTVICSAHTLTFQCYKLAMLMAENAPWLGKIHVLDIGLHPGFQPETPFQLLDEEIVANIFRPRSRFAHKGNFGHALLIAGAYGKMGAAVLAARACLHAGAGLTSAFLPRCGYGIMQTALPEVMVMTGEAENEITGIPPDLEKYAAIGIGPGLGTSENTQKAVLELFSTSEKPVVADADALNCLSLHRDSLLQLPPYSIITPHPKEFERLFGPTGNEFERIALARKKAMELQIVLVLKGHHTLIAQPGGALFFNNTGNAGLAKGGSGDVLTGMLTALLAQGYRPEEAALLGVYLHGLAADLAADIHSQEALTATDITNFLAQGFIRLNRWKRNL